MAQTQGLIQRINIFPNTSPNATACILIGPTPSNTEALLILRRPTDSASQGAFKNSMLDALVAAQVGHREAIATHADGDAEITDVQLIPTT